MTTTAIILAAGMGNRLKEHTTDIPKALVEIGGRPFVDYAIEYAHASGAYEIIVVAGHHFEKLASTLNNSHPEVKIVENTEYTLQNLVTFKLGLSAVPEDHNLLVVNCDYVFHPHTTAAMKAGSEGFSVFCSYDLDGDTEDVMRVSVDRDGNMISMSKTQEEFNAIYNGFWFVESAKIPLLRVVTDYLLESSNLETTTVEEVFREFVKRGEKVRTCDIGASDWMEIDTPEELEEARSRINEYYS